MLAIYGDIGLEGEYTEFIRTFANIVVGGQEYIGSNTPIDALGGGGASDDQPDFNGWLDYSWFDEDYVNGYADTYGENTHDSEELDMTVPWELNTPRRERANICSIIVSLIFITIPITSSRSL